MSKVVEETKMETRQTRKTAPSANPAGFPTKTSEKVRSIVSHHVKSFDYLVDTGVELAVKDIRPMTVAIVDESTDRVNKLTYWMENPTFGRPTKREGDALDPRLFPNECRGRGITYTSPLYTTFAWTVNDGDKHTMSFHVGDIPIMVGSKLCHLNGLNPKQLVRHGEDPHEFGGYFICNGIERCIRMLQVPRRNHVVAIERPSFANRGRKYTSKATMIRSVRRDESGTSVTCHYLNDGNVVVRFMILKKEYFIPAVVLLRALRQTTDREIYDRMCCPSRETGKVSNAFVANHVEVLLRDGSVRNIFSRKDALCRIGKEFRVQMQKMVSVVGMCDEEVGFLLLKRCVLVHLEDCDDKFSLLLLMLRKLWSFASGECAADNADALSSQEILLSGHLYLKILKEQLESVLVKLRAGIDREIRRGQASTTLAVNLLSQETTMKFLLQRSYGKDAIGKALYYFLATGNLRSESGLDLMQNSGFTIVAEKLNWLRYVAHFRSVHRGRFFTEMKTTTVRKLLPETWGFLCCVHTPDGTPCGLLNHICAAAKVESRPVSESVVKKIPSALARLGVSLSSSKQQGSLLLLARDTYLPVLLDGRVVGAVARENADRVARSLRLLKSAATAVSTTKDLHLRVFRDIPATLEVALLPGGNRGGAFPGLYLFTDAARMIRPVQQIKTGRTEWIGPMEQQYMAIECMGQTPRGATHRELDPTNVLSLVASMTPFSDMNQSPRNMYQCQMGKQTMGTFKCVRVCSMTSHIYNETRQSLQHHTPGTPCSNYNHRTDNKMYRLQTPQVPLVQNRNQAEYAMDDHPNGTNCIVAVLAYTGYDMEDAMIINKGAYERGLCHASVYKHKTIDLKDKRGTVKERFGLPSQDDDDEDEDEEYRSKKDPFRGLGADGLPRVGQRLRTGDPMYCAVDVVTDEPHIKKYKEKEEAIVDEVKLLGDSTKASIKLRLVRNPIVGDKFASRAGQKGVLSIRWRQEDMPWTESGMTPDIIINPHAFPSRMTIGMLVESMAGKSGALHGTFQDSTPFRFHENHRAADYFGDQLAKAGYNYYGSEPMYSGVNGTELHCHIFIGVVYYQRLRHMVSDKSQVRSMGPVNSLTMQPVKGRKAGGGVRFGEMERDSLLAHGTAYLLQDRLMNSSDRHDAHACTICGSILGFDYNVEDDEHDTKEESSGFIGRRGAIGKMRCRSCRGRKIGKFAMPYVVRYLANELAAMNICLSVELKG